MKQPIKLSGRLTKPDAAETAVGPFCPINPGTAPIKGVAYKGGAVTSAFISAFLWNINIFLAGLGLGSVAAGEWLSRYRFFFMPLTATLLGMSFYKTYYGACSVPFRNKVMLWVTATLSIGLTIYSLFK